MKVALDLINAERAKAGLALTPDPELMEVARLKAKDMLRITIFHTSLPNMDLL